MHCSVSRFLNVHGGAYTTSCTGGTSSNPSSLFDLHNCLLFMCYIGGLYARLGGVCGVSNKVLSHVSAWCTFQGFLVIYELSTSSKSCS